MTRKSMNERCPAMPGTTARLPTSMLGGSPIRVAMPPTLAMIISMTRNGMTFLPRRSETR